MVDEARGLQDFLEKKASAARGRRMNNARGRMIPHSETSILISGVARWPSDQNNTSHEQYLGHHVPAE
jgi:hypothetical protein